MTDAYKAAGVDIDAGNIFVERIKPLIASTRRTGVISDLGGFGGLFALDIGGMREPVLVSGTDGVGTKLKLALNMGRLDTIGIDLVAMCVNDIACSGAHPLFFLDYFATARLKPEEHVAIVEGIAAGCREARCALIGGETAEMPDLYSGDDFDLAGFAVGIVDRSEIIDGSDIGVGQAIVGLISSGFHSNGYSLIRRIVRDASLNLSTTYDGMDRPLGEMLLAPTIIYSPIIEQLRRDFHIKGIVHVTGGGLRENVPRILPAGVQASISLNSWRMPQMFRFFQRHGSIDDEEMLRVFNCGIGLALIAPRDQAADLISAAESLGKSALVIGQTGPRSDGAPAVVFE
jgi:phosphoribosylformylglycinamidine cyclo-ligase